MPPLSRPPPRKILAEAGKVDILVNNAGVTTRRPAHAHERRGLGRRAGHNLKGAFLFTKAFSRAFVKQRVRPHHQHFLGHRPDRQCRPVQLRGEQGRADRLHASRSRGNWPRAAVTVNAIAPGFIETDMTAELNAGVHEPSAETDSAGQPGPAGGHGGRGVVSRQSGGALCHRPGFDGGRRDGDVKTRHK